MILKNKYTFLLALLLLLTSIALSPTFSNGFTNWDDPIQVTQNKDIQHLSSKNIYKIASSYYVGMYQPLTTMLFAVEYAFFKNNAVGFHTTSLVLHLFNIVLVFLLLNLWFINKRMALLMGCLFAVNPLFVEVIAWVSARSTLLYTFFYLLTLLCYTYFIKRKHYGYYWAAILFFLAALFSKATAITIPFALLLIDFFYQKKIGSRKNLLEKIPFLILAFVFGIIAMNGRSFEDGLITNFTFIEKIFISCYQLVWYVVKFIFPYNLVAYYPNPSLNNGLLNTYFYLSPLVIIAIAVLVYYLKNYRKFLLFGIGFFVLQIALVLKFVQVGNQITADRYMYLASLGFLIVIGSVYLEITSKKRKNIFTVTVLMLATFFAFNTHQKTKIWKNSRTLWTSVVEKNQNIALAYTNLGTTYVGEDNIKAEELFLKATKIDSNYVIPFNNLGYLYLEKDKNKAAYYLLKAIEIDATYLYIYTNLATLYMQTDKEKARFYINKALALNPDDFNVKERVKSWNIRYKN